MGVNTVAGVAQVGHIRESGDTFVIVSFQSRDSQRATLKYAEYLEQGECLWDISWDICRRIGPHLFYSLYSAFAGLVNARERESLDVLEGEEVLLQCR